MVIIELSKLNDALEKSEEKLTDLEIWSLFLKHAPDPKYRELINTLISKEEELGMAATLLMEISQDEYARARIRSQRIAETDRISNLLTAEARGEMRGKLEVARKLKTADVDVSTIMMSTGLTFDDILRL